MFLNIIEKDIFDVKSFKAKLESGHAVIIKFMFDLKV